MKAVRLFLIVCVIFGGACLSSCRKDTVAKIGGADSPTGIMIKDKEHGEITLDEAVGRAIIEFNNSLYLTGECAAEGHEILRSEKDENKTVCFVLASYGEYSFENGNFTKTSGSGMIPAKIVLDKDMSLVSLEMPEDGAGYGESLKKLFPEDLLYTVFEKEASSSYYNTLAEQEHVYAKAYLEKIGRDAPIGEYADFEHILPDMNVSASNALIDLYSDYPMWIGTEEKIENGVRYVYETQWEPSGKNDGSGIITYRKYNYETNEEMDKTVLKISSPGGASGAENGENITDKEALELYITDETGNLRKPK